jgi:predicted enzyme related to lactoylglutathione lyase
VKARNPAMVQAFYIWVRGRELGPAAPERKRTTMAVETQTPPQTKTHTLVHFELPAKNVEKLCSFYDTVFGWKFGSAPGMETYKMAQVGEGDNVMGCGIYAPEKDGARLTNYIGVDSVGEHAAKIESAGGTILQRFSVPGMGHGAIGLDPEGNTVGIWQNDPAATESYS